MRVGIDTRFYSNSPTGIGTYTYELIYNLKKYCNVELVLFLNPDSPLLIDPYFDNIEKIIIKAKKFNLVSLFTLKKVIDNSSLDIFHSLSFVIPFIKTKSIVTIHDLIHLNFKEGSGLKYKLYYNIFVKSRLLNAKRIITISESSKKEINEWLQTDKTDVIYLAANHGFTPHIGISDLFYQLNIDPNNFILYVGNNRPNKNLKRLIIAYAKIKNERPEFADLVLSCPPDNDLNNLIKDNFIIDHVKFLNNVSNDELVIFYSYAIFFVFPSLYEGFGLPVLEAMQSLCPVICSNIDSLKEIFADAAVLFDPKSIIDIKLALQTIYDDNNLRQRLIYLGELKAKMFSWEQTAKKTFAVYAKACN
ncbi:MAG: glycosyltransferase family 4 protein [Candidatus Sericytochromatia bacterium]|nr:glycosyltransferase family 4 protein [Candidatus Sericytochromatia bacterium]